MKKRLFNLLNFVVFNLLFFALYLNFIHRNTNNIPAVEPDGKTNNLKGAVLMQKAMNNLPKTTQPDNHKKTLPVVESVTSPWAIN